MAEQSTLAGDSLERRRRLCVAEALQGKAEPLRTTRVVGTSRSRLAPHAPVTDTAAVEL